jgi:hypothetical protein
VCYIPDDFPSVGFYMSYNQLARMLVGVGALSFVGVGAYLGYKKGVGKD